MTALNICGMPCALMHAQFTDFSCQGRRQKPEKGVL